MSSENEEKAEDELNLTLIEAVRPPQKGELEQLISSELALAIMSTDPLQKIRHVLEAYRLLPPETRKELFTEKERDEFDRLYEVCISFLNMYEEPSDPYNLCRVACIPWSFSWKVADQYLYFVTREWNLNYSNWEEIKQSLSKLSPEKRKAEYLRVLCRTLYKCDMSLAKQVQSEFIVYSMSIISKIMRVIFTSVVSAETWSETLLFMRGRGRQTPTTAHG